MMMVRTTMWIAVVLVAFGCGAEPPDGEAVAEAARVIVVEPEDGVVVAGPDVLVRLEAVNVAIVSAGIDQPSSGHHHLFVNRDPTPVGEPIPTEEGIVHLGGAQTEHSFNDLADGSYRIIAVLGDHQHVRLGSIASDTVNFTVAR